MPQSPSLTASTATVTKGEGHQQLIDPVVASILFSSLLLSAQPAPVNGTVAQRLKDMRMKLSAAIGGTERHYEVISVPNVLAV